MIQLATTVRHINTSSQHSAIALIGNRVIHQINIGRGQIMAAVEMLKRADRSAFSATHGVTETLTGASASLADTERRFDHTTHGAYSVAAALSKILGLDESRTANAVTISDTAFNGLRVTRTGHLSHWKGLAFPNMAACCAPCRLGGDERHHRSSRSV